MIVRVPNPTWHEMVGSSVLGFFFCWHHVHDRMPRLQKSHATFLSDIYFCLKDNS